MHAYCGLSARRREHVSAVQAAPSGCRTCPKLRVKWCPSLCPIRSLFRRAQPACQLFFVFMRILLDGLFRDVSYVAPDRRAALSGASYIRQRLTATKGQAHGAG